jgi:hypothetical protein
MPPNRIADTRRMRAERGCVVAGITTGAGAGAAAAAWGGVELAAGLLRLSLLSLLSPVGLSD